MFLSSSLVPFPTSFKSPWQRVDNKDCTVSLRCPCNHISYEVSVPRRIHHTKASPLCVKEFSGHLNCHAPLLLFLGLVHYVRKMEPGLTILLRTLLMLPQLLVADLSQFVK